MLSQCTLYKTEDYAIRAYVQRFSKGFMHGQTIRQVLCTFDRTILLRFASIFSPSKQATRFEDVKNCFFKSGRPPYYVLGTTLVFFNLFFKGNTRYQMHLEFQKNFLGLKMRFLDRGKYPKENFLIFFLIYFLRFLGFSTRSKVIN